MIIHKLGHTSVLVHAPESKAGRNTCVLSAASLCWFVMVAWTGTQNNAWHRGDLAKNLVGSCSYPPASASLPLPPLHFCRYLMSYFCTRSVFLCVWALTDIDIHGCCFFSANMLKLECPNQRLRTPCSHVENALCTVFRNCLPCLNHMF